MSQKLVARRSDEQSGPPYLLSSNALLTSLRINLISASSSSAPTTRPLSSTSTSLLLGLSTAPEDTADEAEICIER